MFLKEDRSKGAERRCGCFARRPGGREEADVRARRTAKAWLLTAGLAAWGCGGGIAQAPSETAEPPAVEESAAPRATAAVDPALCDLPQQPPSPQQDLAAFSDYAWRLFVALNWPAQAGERGVPDCAAELGGAPTVWESYKTTEQTFLPGARDPGPWNAGGMGQPTLLYRAKAPQGLPVEESIRQAVGGWLIDQNGNPTYYQIGIDETSYDYIRTHRYYDADVVSRAQRIDFPDGSLEVKGAWRILEADEPAERYHTRQAEVMTFDAEGNPTGVTKPARVGLVGFHAVYKAPGFPQWIWTTFEHEDNAPTEGADTSGTWSYYDPSCSGPYCMPNVSPLSSGQPFGSPNQVVRVTPIRADVAAANARWQEAVAGTPFAHYELVAPQWPTAPDDPGQPQGDPTPNTVANTVLESYIQTTSSCMDCHSTARVPGDAVKSNYSFVFLFAQKPETPGGAR